LEIDHCEFPDDRLYDLDNNVWIRIDEKKVKMFLKLLGYASAD